MTSHTQDFPIVGKETKALLDNMGLPDQQSRALVLDEALKVIKQCVPPHSSSGHRTGLACGYVQSGKTGSFTVVTALARDNNYQMVIIIGGTKTNLLNQSNDRLKRDLRLDTRKDRRWKWFESPKSDKRENIECALELWKDSFVSDQERQTVLITVMKQKNHLENLNNLLSEMDLTGVPILVIDDEADRAGLNNKVNKNEISTLYSHLYQLRQLSHTSFLPYTATPQAPLLINIADVLSPDFAEVLTPGKDYIGGKEFFIVNPRLIINIPPTEIPTDDNPVIEPPETFLKALMLFYLGVASGYVLDRGEGNRSMMVHPSRKTAPHGEYFHWTRQISHQWKETLKKDLNDSEREDLLAQFETVYQELAATVTNLPSFQELVPVLYQSINQTNIQEVNAKKGKTPPIDWKNEYAHILVGGQAMDRGFTVEGLTITYMPRGTGVGNADSIQQRARFFGYKRSYLGYCRVFLETDVQDAFKSYVKHEENIRQQLIENRGKSLSEWKRLFFLDKKLKPTRSNVIDIATQKVRFANKWYIPEYICQNTEDLIKSNNNTIDNFWLTIEDKAQEQKGFKYKRKEMLVDKHLFAVDISLQVLLEKLLVNYRIELLQKYFVV